MLTVPVPALVDREDIGEAQRQIGARHDAAREKVPAHPVARALVDEFVRCRAVGEDVHEETAIRLEPAVDPTEQFAVVTHVLEHFYRADPVVLAGRRKVVHVADMDLDVAKPPFGGLLHDVVMLRT